MHSFSMRMWYSCMIKYGDSFADSIVHLISLLYVWFDFFFACTVLFYTYAKIVIFTIFLSYLLLTLKCMVSITSYILVLFKYIFPSRFLLPECLLLIFLYAIVIPHLQMSVLWKMLTCRFFLLRILNHIFCSYCKINFNFLLNRQPLYFSCHVRQHDLILLCVYN